MNLIELTETWAARITLCSNAETLGIDNDTSSGLTEEEATREVVDAGSEVVIEWAADCSTADSDSFFPHWNGGEHYSATYRGYGVAAELYHREPEAQGEDELVYGDWEWMSRKETPRVLQDGMEALVDRIGTAMQAAKDALEANAAVE